MLQSESCFLGFFLNRFFCRRTRDRIAKRLLVCIQSTQQCQVLEQLLPLFRQTRIKCQFNSLLSNNGKCKGPSQRGDRGEGELFGQEAGDAQAAQQAAPSAAEAFEEALPVGRGWTKQGDQAEGHCQRDASLSDLQTWNSRLLGIRRQGEQPSDDATQADVSDPVLATHSKKSTYLCRPPSQEVVELF